MKIKMFTLLIFIVLLLSSCDYYSAAMDYTDNSVLQQVDLHDSILNARQTPYVVKFEGYCLLKKQDLWILLNSRSSPHVRALNDKEIPCMELKDIEWANFVCGEVREESKKEWSEHICVGDGLYR